MKKTFALSDPAKAAGRVLDAIKYEVRRYVKREQRKPLPEGFDIWQFHCRVGPDQDHALECEVGNLNPAIDAVSLQGAAAVYVEIIAEPAHRGPEHSD